MIIVKFWHFVLSFVYQRGLVPGTLRFQEDVEVLLTLLGDMSHEILVITMSSDHRFISSFQKGSFPALISQCVSFILPYYIYSFFSFSHTHSVRNSWPPQGSYFPIYTGRGCCQVLDILRQPSFFGQWCFLSCSHRWRAYGQRIGGDHGSSELWLENSLVHHFGAVGRPISRCVVDTAMFSRWITMRSNSLGMCMCALLDALIVL